MGGPTGGPSFNVGGMGTVNQATLQDLFQSYVNALTKPNVELVTDRIETITPRGVRTADGVEHPADVLVRTKHRDRPTRIDHRR